MLLHRATVMVRKFVYFADRIFPLSHLSEWAWFSFFSSPSHKPVTVRSSCKSGGHFSPAADTAFILAYRSWFLVIDKYLPIICLLVCLHFWTVVSLPIASRRSGSLPSPSSEFRVMGPFGAARAAGEILFSTIIFNVHTITSWWSDMLQPSPADGDGSPPGRHCRGHRVASPLGFHLFVRKRENQKSISGLKYWRLRSLCIESKYNVC